mmetsp:Transcript_11161/g.38779  ORF Transcript_11161/g.38779 Transcript_11161/m.38779 type:complete len:222 (+) Transcript_11161:2658-3323(+)
MTRKTPLTTAPSSSSVSPGERCTSLRCGTSRILASTSTAPSTSLLPSVAVLKCCSRMGERLTIAAHVLLLSTYRSQGPCATMVASRGTSYMRLSSPNTAPALSSLVCRPRPASPLVSWYARRVPAATRNSRSPRSPSLTTASPAGTVTPSSLSTSSEISSGAIPLRYSTCCSSCTRVVRSCSAWPSTAAMASLESVATVTGAMALALALCRASPRSSTSSP